MTAEELLRLYAQTKIFEETGELRYVHSVEVTPDCDPHDGGGADVRAWTTSESVYITHIGSFRRLTEFVQDLLDLSKEPK